MKSRGATISKCSICEFAFFDKENQVYICKLSDKITDENDSCKKFSYDIYKYKPKKSNLFGKFSKEDFEL